MPGKPSLRGAYRGSVPSVLPPDISAYAASFLGVWLGQRQAGFSQTKFYPAPELQGLLNGQGMDY